MSDNGDPVYGKCLNCGKYTPEQIMIMGQFCCEDCAGSYKRCPSCGDYFKVDEETEQEYCSYSCQNADNNNLGESK